ncbi:MAG: hypothetical protein PHY16_07090 [Methylobacter sp.]|nr:hypothetical protein [Methylobacter sp.]
MNPETCSRRLVIVSILTQPIIWQPQALTLQTPSKTLSGNEENQASALASSESLQDNAVYSLELCQKMA